MRRGVRQAFKVVGILLGILVLYAAAAGAWAYTVTPRVIARASKPALINPGSFPAGTMQILLRVEDPGFRKHNGLDPFTPGQGRSTITRALVRPLYLDRYDLGGVAGVGQSVFRFVAKYAGPVDVAPDVMALVLDSKVSKDKQLRLFVQHVYMGTHNGRPVYGFADAARVHFGKSVRELTRRYAMALVGMVIDPEQFDPARHPDALGERISRIDRLMRGQCTPRGVLDVYFEDCAPTRRQASR